MDNWHRPECPRAQFWDAGEHQAPCTCDLVDMPEDGFEPVEPAEDPGPCDLPQCQKRGTICETCQGP